MTATSILGYRLLLTLGVIMAFAITPVDASPLYGESESRLPVFGPQAEFKFQFVADKAAEDATSASSDQGALNDTDGIAIDSANSTDASVASQGDAGGQDLAKAAQNPVANMISVPIQFNYYGAVGPNEDDALIVNVQPVYPVSLTKDWNLITRTIMPLIYLPDPTFGLPSLAAGGGDDFGLGDINFTGFISPANPGKLIWGVGPSLSFPTATDSLMGSEKWSAGPSFVVLTSSGPFTYGALFRHIWSYAGDDGRNEVNQSLVQPFFNYNLPDKWYLTTSPVITGSWSSAPGTRMTVPVGGGIGKIIFLGGKLPVNVQVQAYYHAIRGSEAPEWSARFQMQFMFPK